MKILFSSINLFKMKQHPLLLILIKSNSLFFKYLLYFNIILKLMLVRLFEFLVHKNLVPIFCKTYLLFYFIDIMHPFKILKKKIKVFLDIH